MAVLYAIPTPLGGSPSDALPAPAIERIKGIKDFAVENAKSARAFLGAIGMPVRELNIKVMGEDSDLLVTLHQQRDLGLLSEAGCPAIADPGALLIEAAHREGFIDDDQLRSLAAAADHHGDLAKSGYGELLLRTLELAG